MTERKDVDWESQLKSDEVNEIIQDGKTIKVVLLKGLQRLAQEAGLVKSDCQIINPSDRMVQCKYSIIFSDGTQWIGTGDCHGKNAKPPYVHHPTAMAESRAEARALKKALGIYILSAEELGVDIDASPAKSIASNVIRAIESLCEEKNINKLSLIEKITESSRANEIFELKQLTTEEGQKAMSYLNSLTKKKKTRSDRKAELLTLQEKKKNG